MADELPPDILVYHAEGGQIPQELMDLLKRFAMGEDLEDVIDMIDVPIPHYENNVVQVDFKKGKE